MSDKKLFLLDAFALIYRAHYAFINRPLINSKGHNTSAVTGFTRTVWDLIKREKPTHIAVAFDRPEPTFRHVMFPDYKGNREEQPKDITWSIPYIRKVLSALNIPILEEAGMEADDIIGTMAFKASDEGYDVYMVTPDKDYGQLVRDNIFMYKPSRRSEGPEILGVKEINEKWDIANPLQVIDMLGLQGDTSDNIPGVMGIGLKTAAKLLKLYPSIENMYENIDNIFGSAGKKLAANKENAFLSKTLATIKTDCTLEYEPAELKLGDINREEVAELFNELELRTLKKAILNGPKSVKKEAIQGTLFDMGPSSSSDSGKGNEPLPEMSSNNIGNTKHKYHWVKEEKELHDLIQKLEACTEFCFDTETTHIDATKAEIVGIAFSIDSGEAYYLPCPDSYEESKVLLHKFDHIWKNEKIAKIGQNLKYDLIILRYYDIEVNGKIFDTMIMHYLMEPTLRHNMNYLAESYLNYSPVSIETLIGKKSRTQVQLSMRQVPVEKVVDYACEDADITIQLYHQLRVELKAFDGLWQLYHEVEEPLIKILANMEYEGVHLDAGFLNNYAVEIKDKIQRVQSEIFKIAGRPFNIASPRQVGNVLFNELGVEYRWRKTKTGQYSTSEEKLSELAGEHPVIPKILEYRSINKLLGTYIEPLPLMINARSGRLHSSFNQALTSTGRLSSNNPNIQNIPIRTEEGRRIRKAFVPRDKDHVLVAADYSQVELRLIAEISNDEKMLHAFNQCLDIHKTTAANVYDVAIDEVNSEQRRNAKTVNFSIIYGAGATNLSRQLDIPRKEAADLIKQYFSQYQGVQKYMTEIKEFAQKNGYVETLKGRRRNLRDINSNSGLARSNAERMAINTPIQGTAADLIKIAMKKVDTRLRAEKLEAKMIMQVHDELVFDVPKEELEKLSKIVKEEMENAMPEIKIPLLVDVGTGMDWLEAH